MKKLQYLVIALVAVCVSVPAFAKSSQQEKFDQALKQQAAKAAQRQISQAEIDRMVEKMEVSGQFSKQEMEIAKAIAENEKNTNTSAFLLLNMAISKGAEKKAANKADQLDPSKKISQKDVDLLVSKMEASGQFSAKTIEIAKTIADNEKDPAKAVFMLTLFAPSDDANTCAYCGKTIESAQQHCAAQGYAGLCSAEKEVRSNTVSQPDTHCAKCGEELTIDERYHGAKHVCSKKAPAKQYCIYCGEEILSRGQHCAAKDFTTLCTTTCPECGKDLRDPENLSKDGIHHCKFKTTIKPVEIKK